MPVGYPANQEELSLVRWWADVSRNWWPAKCRRVFLCSAQQWVIAAERTVSTSAGTTFTLASAGMRGSYHCVLPAQRFDPGRWLLWPCAVSILTRWGSNRPGWSN